jgi:hypothetical protein
MIVLLEGRAERSAKSWKNFLIPLGGRVWFVRANSARKRSISDSESFVFNVTIGMVNIGCFGVGDVAERIAIYLY